MGTSAPHSYPGVGTAGEMIGNGEKQYVGRPDGPPEFKEELGMEVPTFIDPREDLRLPKDSGMTWVMYHIPREKRGYYRPDDYPEPYRKSHAGLLEDARVDDYGFLMCSGRTNAGTACQRRAVNFTWKCQAHGGKLHPLDKVVDPRRNVETNPQVQRATTTAATLERMTRWQKLLSGHIKVEDLDDEEIARGQCRDKNGRFTGAPPSMIPAAIKQRMVQELFARGDTIMRESYLQSIETLKEISGGTAYEPADRIKASTYLIERLAGKTPDVVVHTQDKPYEVIFQNIAGGSRAASRARRGVADEEEILEAQVVEQASESTELATIEKPTWGVPSRHGPDPEEYDADDPLHNPYAGLEDEPDPLSDPTQEGVDDIPPIDPEARQNLELDQALREAARKAEIERIKGLKAVQDKERRRRFAARAQGKTEAVDYGYVQVSSKQDDGTYLHRFKEPTLPRAKRGSDDFRHKI